MFQYAAGRRLAAKRGTLLRMDLLWFKNHSDRHFGLECFNIEATAASVFDILKLRGLRMKDWRGYVPGDRITGSHCIETLRRFDPSVLQRSRDTYLQGYFQSEEYFADKADLIRRDFTLREPLRARCETHRKSILGAQSVSLHIRRQDYKTPGLDQYPLPISYYQEAIQYVASRVGNPHFFVFSDEPEWAAANLFTKCPMSIVSWKGSRDYEELQLMMECRHHIIANSSFSWWGAWLNPRVDKIVVAPKQWQRKESSREMLDILPSTWIKL